jgi:Arc/MetJ family transcription regulator
MMRTTLDVDSTLIAEVERLTGESGASKAVNIALGEFVRRRKLQELRTWMGRGDLVDNWRELEELELEEMRTQVQ